MTAAAICSWGGVKPCSSSILAISCIYRSILASFDSCTASGNAGGFGRESTAGADRQVSFIPILILELLEDVDVEIKVRRKVREI